MADLWVRCFHGVAAGPWGSIREGEIRLVPKAIAEGMIAAHPERFAKLKGPPAEDEAVAVGVDVFPPGTQKPYGISFHNLEPLP